MSRLASMGTVLEVKRSGAAGFTQVCDVKKYPKFLGDAEQVETTCVEDTQKTYAPGQNDPGDMEFTLAYTGMGPTTNWGILRAIQLADEVATFRVKYPDNSGFQWDAKVALSMGDVGDGNSPLEFSMKQFPDGEIKPLGELVETPSITTDLPSSDSVASGSNKTLTVVASVSDGGTLTYLWYKNHIALAEIASTMTITGADSGDAGAYRCVITNTKNGAYTSVESNVCNLSVN